MSSIYDIGDERISADFLKLANHDMSYDESILINFIVMFLVFVNILDVYLLCRSYFHFGFRVTSFEYFYSEFPSLFIWNFIGRYFERGELDLSMIVFAFRLVYWHPFRAFKYLHFKENLMFIHEVVSGELDLKFCTATVVFRTDNFQFAFGFMVAFLVDFSRACASFDNLSHIHLDNSYPRLLIGLK